MTRGSDDLHPFVMRDADLNRRNEIVVVAEWRSHSLMFEPVRAEEIILDPEMHNRIVGLAGAWVEKLREDEP